MLLFKKNTKMVVISNCDLKHTHDLFSQNTLVSYKLFHMYLLHKNRVKNVFKRLHAARKRLKRLVTLKKVLKSRQKYRIAQN